MMVLVSFGCSTSPQKNFLEDMVFIPEGPFTMGYAIENKNEWDCYQPDPGFFVRLQFCLPWVYTHPFEDAHVSA